jgi:hypothetical protein
MNKLLVVVPYKLCFFFAATTLQEVYSACKFMLHRFVLGSMVIKFTHTGCCEDGILIEW